jgi:hypothetical protein
MTGEQISSGARLPSISKAVVLGVYASAIFAEVLISMLCGSASRIQNQDTTTLGACWLMLMALLIWIAIYTWRQSTIYFTEDGVGRRGGGAAAFIPWTEASLGRHRGMIRFQGPDKRIDMNPYFLRDTSDLRSLLARKISPTS